MGMPKRVFKVLINIITDRPWYSNIAGILRFLFPRLTNDIIQHELFGSSKDNVFHNFVRRVILMNYYSSWSQTEDGRRQISKEVWGGKSGHLWHVKQVGRKKHDKDFETIYSMVLVYSDEIDEICDMGCGTGYLTWYLSQTELAGKHRFVGVDINPSTIIFAKEHNRIDGVEFVCDEFIHYIKTARLRRPAFIFRQVLMFFTHNQMVEFLMLIKQEYPRSPLFLVEMQYTENVSAEQSFYHNNGRYTHDYIGILDMLGFHCLSKHFQIKKRDEKEVGKWFLHVIGERGNAN